MRCAAPVHQEEKGLSIAPQAALLKELKDLLLSLSVQYSCITFEKKLGEKIRFSLVTVLACLRFIWWGYSWKQAFFLHCFVLIQIQDSKFF